MLGVRCVAVAACEPDFLDVCLDFLDRFFVVDDFDAELDAECAAL